jgi:hypothetical protein
MTVPVDAEASYSFVSTGAATYDIPLRIRDAGDVIVIYSEAHADPAGYSVSAIDQDTPTFTINFSVVPAAAITVMILQSYPIAREVDYNPGQILTADSFNNMLDNLTIMQLDVEAMFDKIAFRYNADEIINITDAMTEIPVPPAAAKQVLLWNTDAWEWKTIDAGGSAAELQLELASATSATDSGAHMVAYWNGAAAVTLQEQWDLLTNASSATDSGANMVDYWNGTAAQSIQEVLDGYATTFDATNITATNFNNQTLMRVGDSWEMKNSAASATIMSWDQAAGQLGLNYLKTIQITDSFVMEDSDSPANQVVGYDAPTLVLTLGANKAGAGIISINSPLFAVPPTQWNVAAGPTNLLNWSSTTSQLLIGESGPSGTNISIDTPSDELKWSNSSLTAAATTLDPIVATRGWSLNQLQAVVAASPTYADFVTNVAAL